MHLGPDPKLPEIQRKAHVGLCAPFTKKNFLELPLALLFSPQWNPTPQLACLVNNDHQQIKYTRYLKAH